MQLRQLEIFLAVAKRQSFSKAAEAMSLAQPTVSSHVRALETELGARLFVRSTKGLGLTEQGRLFYTYAAQIINFTERAESEVRAMEEQRQNRLAVSASSVPAQYLIPAVLPEVRRKHPSVCFCIREGDSTRAAEDVLNGEVELGIVGSEEPGANLKYLPVVEERLVLVTPDTPEFRELNGRLDAMTLQNLPFIAREEGSGTRKNTEALLRSMSVLPERMRVAAELPSTECVMRSVMNGLGVSIVSKLAADSCANSGGLLLFELDGPLARRWFYCVFREDMPVSPGAQSLIDALRAMGSIAQS